MHTWPDCSTPLMATYRWTWARIWAPFNWVCNCLLSPAAFRMLSKPSTSPAIPRDMRNRLWSTVQHTHITPTSGLLRTSVIATVTVPASSSFHTSILVTASMNSLPVSQNASRLFSTNRTQFLKLQTKSRQPWQCTVPVSVGTPTSGWASHRSAQLWHELCLQAARPVLWPTSAETSKVTFWCDIQCLVVKLLQSELSTQNFNFAIQ